MFTANTVTAGGVVYRDLPSKQFLTMLLDQLDSSKARKSTGYPTVNGELLPMRPSPPPNDLLTQDLFYHVFSNYLQPGDIVLAETGTAGHGCRDFKMPPHSFLFKPTTWLSIGYMLPATQGAGLAQRELHATGEWHTAGGNPRTVLLIGDGSFQMTAQELSTIIREKERGEGEGLLCRNLPSSNLGRA
jgi:pyruvate decarboxylase